MMIFKTGSYLKRQLIWDLGVFGISFPVHLCVCVSLHRKDICCSIRQWVAQRCYAEDIKFYDPAKIPCFLSRIYLVLDWKMKFQSSYTRKSLYWDIWHRAKMNGLIYIHIEYKLVTFFLLNLCEASLLESLLTRSRWNS